MAEAVNIEYNGNADEKKDFKMNLAGYVYQLKLLLIFLWRGYKNKDDAFQIGTEIKEAEKLDDVVYFQNIGGETHVRYVQAKYARSDAAELKYNDFVDEWDKARCNLKKYFISFRKIKQRGYPEKIDGLILCTNIPFQHLTLKKNDKLPTSLTFKEVTAEFNDKIFYDAGRKWEKYQFEPLGIHCNELKEKLHASTNLKLLAQEFTRYFFKKENDPNMDLQNYWISSYINVLIKENVIAQEVFKFAELNESPANNKEIRKNEIINEFHKLFEKAMDTKLGKKSTPEELQHITFAKDFIIRLKEKRDKVQATLEEIAEILAANVLGGTPVIPNKKFDYLVQILRYSNESVFSYAFITGKDLSVNANKFRNIFLEVCKTQLVKHLKEYKMFSPNALNDLAKCGTASSHLPATLEDEKNVAEQLIGHIFYENELRNIFQEHFTFLKDVFELKETNNLIFSNDFVKNINQGNFRNVFLTLFIHEKLTTQKIKFKQDFANFPKLVTEIRKSYDVAKKEGILKWAKTKEDTLLNVGNAKDFLGKIKTELSDQLKRGYSVQYCNKLQEYDVTFKTNVNNLADFLMDEQKQILHLRTNSILLTAIKLVQNLRRYSYYQNNDSFSIAPLKAFSRMENYMEPKNVHVSNMFESKSDLLIIVDTQSELKSFWERFSHFLSDKDKKVIIISNNTAESLVDTNFCAIVEEKIKFEDLTTYSYLWIMKSKINFQGIDISLNKIISDEDASELIDAETLEKLVKFEKIVVGNALPTKMNYYRPRKLRLIQIRNKFFKEYQSLNNHLFAIQGNDALNLLKEHNVKDDLITDSNSFVNGDAPLGSMFIIMESTVAKAEFDKICNICPDYCIHWLECDGRKLIWFHSYSPESSSLFTEFKQYSKKEEKEERNHFVEELYFEKYIKQNQVVIIADSAGMGKSTILTSFMEKEKEKEDFQQWIIRINLNLYTDILLKIKNHDAALKKNIVEGQPPTPKIQFNFNFASFDPIKKDYGKLILESVINEARNEEETTRCFENRFFIYCFAKREMVIMVDGFDEINPDYGIVVMQILERLAEEKKNRIWITSRTIFKDQLEDKFNTFAYDLKPFCKEDGEIFLKEFWKQEWKEQKGSVIPNESDLENYVENLIKESYNRIGTVVGIPLQTKMIAEIFQEKDTDDDSKIIWQSCFEYLEMTKPSKKPNFMAKLKNIYILYEDFFKKCMFTYFLQEKAIVDLRKPFAKKIKRDVYINEYKAHKIFGVIALQDMHKDSLAAEEPEIIKNWLTDFDEGVENIGIINNFNGEGHPLFTHLTYAEYFAACYVHDKLIYDLSSARKTFEIANEILKKDVPVFAECLKFLLNENLCKKKLKDILNGKTALKFAMQHGFVNCVNLFISNKDLDDNFLYAVHSSQPEVVIYLTLYIYHFFYLKLKPSKHIAFCYLQQFITEAAEGSWENVDPTIAAFLKNILDLNQESLKPENMLPFAELIKFPYSVVQRKRINMSNAVETLKNSFALENIGKLSIENIKLIINLLEPITSQKWVAILIDDLCVRQDLTEAEKIQFFQELFNQINDPQEKMVFTNEMFNLVIRNDCGKRFDQILKNDKIPIHYFLINKEQLIECFTTACKNNLKRIIKITLRYFKKKQLYINSLHIACRYNATLEIIKVIQNTQHWSSINEQDVDGKTALLIALQNNCNLRKIEFLIENGADPNIPDKIKKTPWIYVIENADNETIEFFLRSYFNSNYHLESKLKLKTYFQNSDSFDINLKKNGRLRLHKAICDKDILFCKFLMRNGADVHIRDSEGKTPLYRACENGLYEFVKWLLLSGASYNEEDLEQLNIFDDDILNFLNTASTNFENLSKEKYTVTKNKYIRNATNRKKQTLSHIAVKSNILDNVKQFDIPYLKEQINKQDIDGNTALHFAMEGKNIEIIELLLEMGAYFDISNKKGITPLSMNTNNFVPLLKLADDEFRAINFRRHSHRFSTEENIRRLLKMKDVHGKTLLHYAVIFDKSVEVTCLLYYGADKNAKDKKCRTPLYYARHYMMKYMLINGALFDLKPYFTEETYIQSNHFARTIAHWFTLIYYEEYELLLENFELMKDRHHDGRCLIDDLHIMLHTRDINNRSLCYYILNDDKLLLRLLLKGIIIPFLFISHNLPSMKNMRIRKLIILLKYFAEELLENKVARVNLFKYYKWQILNLNISFPSLRFDRNDVDAILKTVQEKIDKYDVKSLSEFVKKYSHEKRT